MTPTLVLTRPDAQSREIAAALGSVRVIISPVMRIAAAQASPDVGDYSGIVLTSANAVDFAPDMTGMPVYCVGARTADAARMAGADVRLVARDADDLVSRFDGQGPLLHLRGEHARGNIAERLGSAGIVTDEAVVYRQEPLPLSTEAVEALQGTAAIVLPLYSPRTAQLVGEQIKTIGANVEAIAMSQAVAEAWREAAGLGATVLPAPTGEEMLKAIRDALRR